MIRPIVRSMVRPIVRGLVGGSGGGASPVFSPLTASYSNASFTPVVISNTEIISFHVKGLSSSSDSQYIFGGSITGAYVFYRGSDGRFRVATDTGNIRQVYSTILNDGGEYFVEIKIDPLGWDLYIDSNFIVRSAGSISDITLDRIGMSSATTTMTIGAVYGVTLGGSASWPMQSVNDDEFDGEDMIGSNDLTYNGAPVPITSADTIETNPL